MLWGTSRTGTAAGLAKNNYDRDKCEQQFENYRACRRKMVRAHGDEQRDAGSHCSRQFRPSSVCLNKTHELLWANG